MTEPKRVLPGHPIEVILFRSSGKYYTQTEWRMPSTDEIVAGGGDASSVHYPACMNYSPSRGWRDGIVLIPAQDPWGFPGLLLPDPHLADEGPVHANECGAWPELGGCILPAAHNLGRLDVPGNHRFAQVTRPRRTGRTAADEVRIQALEKAGYVVLRAKSYCRAQERQRVAEALLASEREHNEGTRHWAEQAFAEQRRLGDRLTFVYGVARAYGATAEELANEPKPCG